MDHSRSRDSSQRGANAAGSELPAESSRVGETSRAAAGGRHGGGDRDQPGGGAGGGLGNAGDPGNLRDRAFAVPQRSDSVHGGDRRGDAGLRAAFGALSGADGGPARKPFSSRGGVVRQQGGGSID